MYSTSESAPVSAYIDGPTAVAELPPIRPITGRRAARTPKPKKALNRAVLYLRVSDKSQVNTDYDPEGFSLPAQRLACQRKAEQLGLEIVEEYVEPGRSATEMTKRVRFQEMLTRIRRSRDVDHVVVYKLSRMNRSRLDDAIVMADLRKRGVTLISATESIDDTPQGQLMHGILASFNEFRSTEEGEDIAYKMGEKAKKGGTISLAPLGYENIVHRYEERLVHTVAVDEKRAVFIRLLFELYATGDYTIPALQQELTDRGLRSRPTAARPAGPISTSKIRDILCDRYYLGIVTYRGIEYEGRHPAIVDEEVFARVQQLLEERGVSGEHRRVHHHYLKGSLFCGACERAGRTPRRMIVRHVVGRGGNVFYYFFCRGTQDHTCTAPYSRRLEVEDAVVEHYRTIAFTPAFLTQMRTAIQAALKDDLASQHLLNNQLNAQLASLDTKEQNLIDLAADAALPQAKIRAQLLEIARQRTRLQEQLGEVKGVLDTGAAYVEACLHLLENPYELYRHASDAARRRLNQALFTRILVDNDEVVGHELREPFAELLAIDQGLQARRAGQSPEQARRTAERTRTQHAPERTTATPKDGGVWAT